MRTSTHALETTHYKIRRHFGTSSVTDLITNSVENICKSAIELTTLGSKSYNILGSVREVTNDNR